MSEFAVDFPTLGFLAADWVAAHCPIPGGFLRGQPYVMYDWQLWCTVSFMRVRPEAEYGQLAQAFHFRRAQVVGPQKIGKGPWSATHVALEGAGPALFAGWAGRDDGYACSEHGCGCGWEYGYEPGEPMGMRWPTPLIQLLSTSEDQVANIYEPFKGMVKQGPLGDIMKVGEEFTRIGDDGKIEVVTSSAMSRLGNPITHAVQDETGLYTKANKLMTVAETQRRGAAGMGGRTMETTNAWDPAENSTAQKTAESRRPDIFRFHRLPPAGLKYTDRRERRRIHAHVYEGSTHVDLDSIEAEAAELMETDPQQAERFFGNRLVQGAGTWLPDGLYAGSGPGSIWLPDPPDGTAVCGGFDGSENDDWTAIKLETIDGRLFTPRYGPDRRPTIWNPAEWGGRVPRSEVYAAWDELARRYRLKRVYLDPPGWRTEISDWAAAHGQDVFIEWPTYKVVRMHPALESFATDLGTGALTTDGCPITADHVANARKRAQPGDRYILQKPSGADHQKIDAAVTSVLAHEAAGDARRTGWATSGEGLDYGMAFA